MRTTRAQRRSLADQRAADKDTLVARGRRSSARHGRTLRVRAIKAFEAGQTVGPVLHDYLQAHVARDMVGAMIAAHLTGVLETAAVVGRYDGERGRGLASMYGSYHNAVEFLRRRAQLTPDDVEAMRRAYGREAVAVTREVGTQLERQVADAVEESVRRGEHVRAGTARVRAAFDAAGVTPKNPYLFTTLYRTQVALAYGAGQAAVRADPAIDVILWGYEYVTVGDDRVRPSHVGYDGVVLPKDDMRWREIMPPNGYNCRCEVIEVFHDDRATPKPPPDTVEVDGQVVRVQPDNGWAFSPADLAADVRSFGPGLLAV